jgi:hypothetical protein
MCGICLVDKSGVAQRRCHLLSVMLTVREKNSQQRLQ